MTSQCMQLDFEVSKIPDADCLVGRARSDNEVRGRVEGERVDGILVTVSCGEGRCRCSWRPKI